MRTAVLVMLATAMALVVAARLRKYWSAPWLALAALLGTGFLEGMIWKQGGYLVLSALLYLVALLLLASSAIRRAMQRRTRSDRSAGTEAKERDALGLTLAIVQVALAVLATASEAIGANRLRGSAWVGILVVVSLMWFFAIVRIPPRHSDMLTRG
jgi:hypothetical protein